MNLWLGHDFKNPLYPWEYFNTSQDIMISAYQLLQRPNLIKMLKYAGLHDSLRCKGRIFLDSGAFAQKNAPLSALSTNSLINLQRDIKANFYSILDIPLSITDSSAKNHRRWKNTIKNGIDMKNKWAPGSLIPIFHGFSSNAIKFRSSQMLEIWKKPQMIAIGSLVPLLKGNFIGNKFSSSTLSPFFERWKTIIRTITKLKEIFKKIPLHAFGVGGMSTIYIFSLLGINSLDSVSWRIKAAYGAIQLPGLSDRFFINENKSYRKIRRNIETSDLELLEKCNCPICSNNKVSSIAKELASHFEARAIHNAYIVQSEIEKINNINSFEEKVDFVRKRLEFNNQFLKIVDTLILPEQLIQVTAR